MDDDSRTHLVVVNHEEHYEVRTDMRPLSAR